MCVLGWFGGVVDDLIRMFVMNRLLARTLAVVSDETFLQQQRKETFI